MNRNILAAVAVPLFALAGPAMALTTISQTVAVPVVVAPGASSISFAQFDTTLGTLVSIDLSFAASSSTTVNFVNNTPVTRLWTITPAGVASLSGHGFNLSSAVTGSASIYTLLPRFSPSNPRLGSQTFNAAYADSDSLASGFAPYEGTGSIAFAFARLASFAVVGSGGGSTISATPIGGSATLSYNYELPTDSVPEPATWAMLMIGFGFVGLSARRRGVLSA